MKLRAFAHLSDQALLEAFESRVNRERLDEVELLDLMGEIDDRRLYLARGFSSMHAYCVHAFHLCADQAYKRIHAARTGRRFPAVLEAMAEGRLHLSAVVMLGPHLTPDNARDLIAAAHHQPKRELEYLLATRFPRPHVATRVEPIASRPARAPADGAVKELPKSLAPGQVESAVARPKLTPLDAEWYALRVSIPKSLHDKMAYAHALLGHEDPATAMAEGIESAYDALIALLEKRKIGTASRPRSGRRSSSADPRHVPPGVKLAVWKRDGGQCGFVSDDGQRCPATARLEYDHVDPVACGGEATVENIRLRCRAHNQYEAECVFGAGFMHEKREAARQARAARAGATATTKDPEKDVIPWLRQLGVRVEECRRVAMLCEALPPETSLEERVRHALRQLTPVHRRVEARPATAA